MQNQTNVTRTRRAISLVVGTLAGAFILASDASAFSPESSDPIKVAQHDWAGSDFSTHLMVRLLKEAGYNAEPITIDASSVYTALQNGDIAFDVEAWTTSHPELAAMLTAGKMTNVGESGLLGMDRYWYPDYVKALCPGLPDYKALNGCAKIFATAETGEKGRLLLYPEDWGGFDDKRVANLGLNFEIVRAGSEAALLAEVKSAVQRKAPILAWLYEPHWAPVAYKGEYVQLPPYSEACITSESYACEKPQGPILKLAWNGSKAKWPHGYKIFEAMKLDNKEYGDTLTDISLKGESVSDAVDAWMQKNKDRWTAWLK